MQPPDVSDTQTMKLLVSVFERLEEWVTELLAGYHECHFSVVQFFNLKANLYANVIPSSHKVKIRLGKCFILTETLN